MRVCEYFPFAISNGENENIYLESDYKAMDQETLAEDLAKYKEDKLKAIAALEAELEEMKTRAGGLL